MKIFFKIILVSLITLNAFGTAQRPDILIYKTDTLGIFTNPIGDSVMYMYADTNFLRDMCTSTNCWRGYVGTYKIIEDKLYLIKLSDCCNSDLTVDFSVAFPLKLDTNGVFVKWFQDTIYAPHEDMIYYSHMGYETVYKKEIRLAFRNGIIISKDTVDNTKTRLTYYGSNKLSEFVIKNSPEGTFDNLKKEIRLYVDIESDEFGNVTKVTIPEGAGNKSEYDNVIIETILKIEDWDVLYRHGKRADLPWLFPISIDKKSIRKYGL